MFDSFGQGIDFEADIYHRTALKADRTAFTIVDERLRRRASHDLAYLGRVNGHS